MMEFNGTFEITGVSTEEAWLALSDPVMIGSAAPGVRFLVSIEEDDPDFETLQARVDGEEPPAVLPHASVEMVADRAFEEGARYAAVVEPELGSISPRFESVLTVTKREYPEMRISGTGRSANSEFEVESGMTVREEAEGVRIEWWATADIFGRIAQMGQRVLNPVATRISNRFFANIEAELQELDQSDRSLRDRIRELI